MSGQYEPKNESGGDPRWVLEQGARIGGSPWRGEVPVQSHSTLNLNQHSSTPWQKPRFDSLNIRTETLKWTVEGDSRSYQLVESVRGDSSPIHQPHEPVFPPTTSKQPMLVEVRLRVDNINPCLPSSVRSSKQQMSSPTGSRLRRNRTANDLNPQCPRPGPLCNTSASIPSRSYSAPSHPYYSRHPPE